MNNYEEQLKTELKIIDKDNRTLQQENIYLREKCKQLQTTVKEAIEYIEQIIDFVAEDKREIERDKYILKLLKGDNK